MSHPRPDFAEALSEFPDAARSRLSSLVSTEGFKGVVPATEAAILAAALDITIPELMLKLLPFAIKYSRAEISAFKVGAVASAMTGNLYFGANMEFAGESLVYTVHAEQSATVNAWMSGETGMSGLALSAAPCGYCRQFLYELVTASRLQIYLDSQPPRSITEYLPDPFGPHDLGNTAGLMSPQDNRLVLDHASTAELVVRALATANRSYAPYTSFLKPNRGQAGFAGVALRTADGSIFCGSYGENAAHNPSVLPMESALVMLTLGGYDHDDIVEAVLVQGHVADDHGPINSRCDQQAVSANVLKVVSNTRLQVFFAHQT